MRVVSVPPDFAGLLSSKADRLIPVSTECLVQGHASYVCVENVLWWLFHSGQSP